MTKAISPTGRYVALMMTISLGPDPEDDDHIYVGWELPDVPPEHIPADFQPAEELTDAQLAERGITRFTKVTRFQTEALAKLGIVIDKGA